MKIDFFQFYEIYIKDTTASWQQTNMAVKWHLAV